ncbi:aldehyde ferredoxin oxidoreductase family protein [Acetohalobium arabaticum]|uniref:Aldehyde ferredoxin oxidoreductase n=1 Tax=Acetohalobium arabaticum (strain ATCC 49924 / DSM 5501 / Z-7288) TaxID=574087 RepID=D9QR56_ACEAZ|nr:aldehyde ferredoxin oxidoreductase family protein [Acetohalobium arabaticum]ADL12997.1 Aldehyde ferredoxin oxidoreductase [Acetohalobium arabaticum DSM 5501]
MNNQLDGWQGRVLWVDLTEKEVYKEELSEDLCRKYLGQSGINAKILYDNVGPEVDPLDPENYLIFGVGPLGGTLAPCSGRFTVTSKAPLTGLFGDSNCGGHWGPELKYAGYDHIVITGKADQPVYLWINDEQVELRDASKVWGKTTWATEEYLQEKLGNNTIQVASIGPAGENLVNYAAIICNHNRAAGRTGMGAVMGSKNLKAIAVYGSKEIKVAEPKEFLDIAVESQEDIMDDPLYEVANTFGTTAITRLAQELGFLPTKNFQESTFSGADKLSGEKILEKYATKHKGCFNCPVSCSRYYKVDEGEYEGTVGEGPEYETISAMGTKCGNENLPSVLKANTLANQLGLDTISTGSVISWAMELYQRDIITSEDTGGLELEWGNHQELIELVKMIAHRKGFGDLLAKGAFKAAQEIGNSAEEYVVHSKGMEYPAVDVRGTKGMALGFAVASRGGDHLKSLPLYEIAHDVYKEAIQEELGIEVEDEYWTQYETKPRLIAWHEEWHCVVDSLGLCKLEGIALKPLRPKHFAQLVSAATGVEFDEDRLQKIGERIWNLERLFNIREGLSREDDMPPKRMLEETIATGPSAGEGLSSAKFNSMLDEYYSLRGWDLANGIPKKQKLEELNLNWEVKKSASTG